MSDSLVTPWTIACQAPLSMGFPKQEYCSGLPFTSPGDLPDSGIESTSPALAGRFSTTEPPGKPLFINVFLTFPKRTKGNKCSDYNSIGCNSLLVEDKFSKLKIVIKYYNLLCLLVFV